MWEKNSLGWNCYFTAQFSWLPDWHIHTGVTVATDTKYTFYWNTRVTKMWWLIGKKMNNSHPWTSFLTVSIMAKFWKTLFTLAYLSFVAFKLLLTASGGQPGELSGPWPPGLGVIREPNGCSCQTPGLLALLCWSVSWDVPRPQRLKTSD